MSDTDLLLQKNKRLQLRISWVVLFAYAIPILGMPISLLLALITDFQRSTWNHCGVVNIIPSLSAIVKSQRKLWRIFTYSHFPFRILFAWLYFGYYRRKIHRKQHFLIYLATVFYIQESLTTLMLAIFADITGKNLFHVSEAVSLWISCCGYILVTYFMYKYCRRDELATHEQISLQLKKIFMQLAIVAQIFMWPWYYIHNIFCLPLAYSVFALMELIFMWANLGYHTTAYYDFYYLKFGFNRKRGCYFVEF